VTCPGSLIVNADGVVAGCIEDDERNLGRGRELRHEGDVIPLGGCRWPHRSALESLH
jgi:hypothetical protein